MTEVNQGPSLYGSSSAANGRAEWIEIAKGIAVTFVILVHSMIPDINPVTTHLSSFTIPVFFMLTGITYDNQKYRGQIEALAKLRARQLLIPYVLLYFIMMILFVPLSPFVGTHLTPVELVFWFLYGNGPPNSASHLWFLPVLYLGLMVFALIDKAMYRLPRGLKWLALVILLFAAYAVWSVFTPILVPWRLSSVLIASAFVLIGNELRLWRGLEPFTTGSTAENALSILLLATLVLNLSHLNGFTDMAVDNYGMCFWLYLPAGTFGCLLVFEVSSVLRKSLTLRRCLFALGGVSQEVYEVHPLAFYLIPIVAVILGVPMPAGSDVTNLVWLLRFMLGVTLSYVLASRLIRGNRVLSFIFSGRSRRQSSAVP